MFVRPAFTRRLLRHLLVVGAIAAAVLVATNGTALAQTPPGSDQGPRFNGWGPGQGPPLRTGFSWRVQRASVGKCPAMNCGWAGSSWWSWRMAPSRQTRHLSP